MARSFIVILLLAVFFLTGMLYGMDNDDTAINDESEGSDQAVVIEEEEIETIESSSIDVMDRQEPVHFVQKAASFLETFVKGFYELVVQGLYQVSQLFF
ncbi:hypothetical protein KFZ58_10665 [Virgibacillus sp. NKC19-16]|uniref:hypothetical protein n=1 Tax=Virgibacillus salidurans TaxID=2831673 RepID=UPI001F41247F|nr:hypothetical protein [Virgibacillus sp. NKC19-16]UJL44890.1 hypothetical protein KFZ58_10665 [Virgibacillus sp. NKC19-16]